MTIIWNFSASAHHFIHKWSKFKQNFALKSVYLSKLGKKTPSHSYTFLGSLHSDVLLYPHTFSQISSSQSKRSTRHSRNVMINSNTLMTQMVYKLILFRNIFLLTTQKFSNIFLSSTIQFLLLSKFTLLLDYLILTLAL